MFYQILSVDIEKRIPQFFEKIQPLSKDEVLSFDAVQEVVVDDEKKSNTEALLVSIYQTIDENFLAQFPKLRYIGVLGTSHKKIPLEYCTKHNISVSVVHEYCDDETAEWSMLQLIKFFREAKIPQSVCEKKLGVIGVGAVGKKFIQRALAFEMEIFFDAPTQHQEFLKFGVTKASKEEIFATCDVISFHTPPHFSWLSRSLLEHAKKNLCMINTCMGKISFHDDLENFLHDRSDVTLIMDQIALKSYGSLKKRAMVFDKPAFFTVDSSARLIKKFINNIECALKK